MERGCIDGVSLVANEEAIGKLRKGQTVLNTVKIRKYWVTCARRGALDTTVDHTKHMAGDEHLGRTWFNYTTPDLRNHCCNV